MYVIFNGSATCLQGTNRGWRVRYGSWRCGGAEGQLKMGILVDGSGDVVCCRFHWSVCLLARSCSESQNAGYGREWTWSLKHCLWMDGHVGRNHSTDYMHSRGGCYGAEADQRRGAAVGSQSGNERHMCEMDSGLPVESISVVRMANRPPGRLQAEGLPLTSRPSVLVPVHGTSPRPGRTAGARPGSWPATNGDWM